jgi:hypothetical protein
VITDKDIEYLQARLHSKAMRCRQCDITRALLAAHLNSQESRVSEEPLTPTPMHDPLSFPLA